jgi:outer membrane protein assembly factor BamB
MRSAYVVALYGFLVFPTIVIAEDWPMGGRTRDRNPVSLEKGAPVDWQMKTEDHTPRNIRWSVATSGYAFGGPVVANGMIWVGASNSRNPHESTVTDDRGVLACYRAADGKFLYQYTAPRLEKYTNDWPMNGLSGSPIIEGDNLWFITNRREVVCLDIAPLRRGDGPAKERWKYDLIAAQGVVPSSPQIHTHNTLGSLAMHDDLLFVPTGNGVAFDHPSAHTIKAPQAPALVCLRKETGALVWKDSSAGKLGYSGHHASPLVIEIAGQAQVIHPQADGWVRSYDVRTGKIVWTFDTNFKSGKWAWSGEKNVNNVVTATPVFADGRVYFAQGREHEFSGRYGRLFCIDPSKRGDISREVVDGIGAAGTVAAKANPNSGLIWEFAASSVDDRQRLQETGASAAVADGLVIVPDNSGLVHCFDAASGRRYWQHEATAGLFGDPLIVDGKIYVVGDDGYVAILKLAKTKELIATMEMDEWIVAPPIFSNGTLYILTMHTLHAIRKP